MTRAEPDFDRFVAEHGRELECYAFVLSGDSATAQDLVQTALLKAYRRWRRVSQVEHPAAYVRKILTNTYLDLRRRPIEHSVAELPDLVADGLLVDPGNRVVAADEIRRALTVLSPQQRAVIVLRHLAGLDDAAIADELGCSQGTVRTHASRGLHRMHAVLDEAATRIEPDRKL
jgi:RNA polymerase sigma-70 factor (sigma-E family)